MIDDRSPYPVHMEAHGWVGESAGLSFNIDGFEADPVQPNKEVRDVTA
jgi:hypothetical protein